MTLAQFKKFFKREHQRMVEYWGNKENQKQRTLFRTIKLSEEVGEVCEEILGFTAQQRKKKIRKFNKEKLAEEIADVIVVAILLAENLDINIWKAIEKKIKKVERRGKP